MGIKGLTALISENAPSAIKEHEIKTLFGRKVAIDASMSIYQFLIAVRQKDGEMLTNEAGETTSHLMGFFYRTIRIVENGIKPVYVFDGKPPEMKANVLKGRFERRVEAQENQEEAKEVGTVEEMDKFSRRTVKVTKQHNEECRRLLKLMGIPVVIAPSEAEAQCAELARAGKVYAAGSEDMDTLTFSTPILYRHLTSSEARKQPILEVVLEKALEGLEMDMSTFIDLCLLLGCDYLDPIKGVGPKSALKLIREHGSLKSVIKHLRAKQAEKEATAAVEERSSDEEPEPEPENESDAEHAVTSEVEPRASSPPATSEAGPSSPPTHAMHDNSDGESDSEKPKKQAENADSKATKGKVKKAKKGGVKRTGKNKGKGGIHVPENWPWEDAKRMFEKPDVTPGDQVELEWKNPDIDGLIEFLVKEKGFNEDRVRKGAEKLTKFLNSKQQGRLDGFFTIKPKESKPAAKDAKGSKGAKRKGEDTEKDKKSSGSKKARTKK